MKPVHLGAADLAPSAPDKLWAKKHQINRDTYTSGSSDYLMPRSNPGKAGEKETSKGDEVTTVSGSLLTHRILNELKTTFKLI